MRDLLYLNRMFKVKQGEHTAERRKISPISVYSMAKPGLAQNPVQ